MRMLKIRIYCVFTVCFLIFTACDWNDKKVEAMLDRAEILADQYPDSALILLDSVEYPRSLDEKLYNRYMLLRAYAGDKTVLDSTIFHVKTHYEKNRDMKNAAMASFYCGRTHHLKKDLEKATQAYLDAEKYAQSIEDNNLKGRIQHYIGDLNLDKLLKDDAIQRYNQAGVYFNLAGKYRSAMSTYHRLGTCYLLKNNPDSALFNYEKALEIAQLAGDSVSQGVMLQGLGVIYKYTGDWNQARECYHKSFSYFSGKENKARAYLDMAGTFNKEGKDSVEYYIDKAFELIGEEGNPLLEMQAFLILSEAEEKNGNYEQALSYYKDYTEQVNKEYQNKESKEILDIQRKYNFELIKNENNRLTIQTQATFLIVLGLLLALAVLGIFVYRKHVANREALKDAQEKVNQLKEMAELYKENRTALREVLYAHFDILKDTALLEGYLREDERKQGQKFLKRFNEVVYNQDSFDWNVIEKTMERLFDKLPIKLKKAYPQLDESEYRICCLTYAQLSNTEIAIIMRLSINTVQSKKSSTRKKLNIEGYGNIIDFLNKELNMPQM